MSPGGRRRRGALHFVTMLAFNVIALELMAFIIYTVRFDEGFSYRRISDEQRGTATSGAAPTEAAGQPSRHAVADALHPYLGYVYNPEFWNATADRRSRHAFPVSDYGFVDDKSPIQRPATDRVVVGVFGGSVAMALAADGLEALFGELGKHARYTGKTFVTVRVPLGSHKQPQQLMALAYILSLGGHFDIVINLDGFNEVALPLSENLRKGSNPFFPLNWQMRVDQVSDVALLRLIGTKVVAETERRSWAATFVALPLRYSVVAGLVWQLQDNRLALRIHQAAFDIQEFESESTQMSYEAKGPAFEPSDKHTMYARLAKMWRDSSLQMSRLSAANDTEYFHFLQPNQYVTGSKIMGEEERSVSFNPRHIYRPGVQDGYPHLIEAGNDLRERGVAFHDLSMIFRELERPLYVDTCCHLSEEGMALIGKRMGELILADLDERN
jgi:hypothetical protein